LALLRRSRASAHPEDAKMRLIILIILIILIESFAEGVGFDSLRLAQRG
jgi:hypothetical protein